MLAISWKALAGVLAAAFAGILVIACWPRLEPSALNAKASVEQPVFVKAPVVVSALKPAATAAQPFARDAIGKLASALRDQPPALRGKDDGGPGAALAIPIDDGRRLCAEGLVAFAEGDIATARAFFVSAAEAGDARALVALGDTFDPATLTRLGVVGLKGDGAKARDYYARALAAGATGARERLAALAAK
jgi:TPR repeat protein